MTKPATATCLLNSYAIPTERFRSNRPIFSPRTRAGERARSRTAYTKMDGARRQCLQAPIYTHQGGRTVPKPTVAVETDPA